MNRRESYEKRKLANIRMTSAMAPTWMQCEAKRDNQRFQLFKPISTNGTNMRIEKKRVILQDKEELPKSIFNTGSIRHNMISDP